VSKDRNLHRGTGRGIFVPERRGMMIHGEVRGSAIGEKPKLPNIANWGDDQQGGRVWFNPIYGNF